MRVLVEEIAKRTDIRLPVATTWPADTVPVDRRRPARDCLEVGRPGGAAGCRAAAAPGREGYRVAVNAAARRCADGARARRRCARRAVRRRTAAARAAHVARLVAACRRDSRSSPTPQVALRGHQLGYRPKTNAYDAWDVPMWEQYIRDLAIFGTNAIELIPPRSDDAADSPHFPLPQIDMMVEMSRLADEYGQDVWIWYPALDKDYGDPKQVEFALKEWAEVFQKLPRIDAIFVPGRRSRAHAAEAPDGAARAADGEPAQVSPQGRRCGCRRRASRRPGWTSSTRSSRPSRHG